MAGGVVLVAIAGLRRTEGALPRFLDHNRAGDASVVFNEDLPLADQEALAAKVSELPMVTDAGAGALVVLTEADAATQPSSSLTPFVAVDGRY